MSILTREQLGSTTAEAWSAAIELTYEDLLRKAVLAEREACAQLVEAHGTWDTTESLAAAIRARK